jgi:hypothetical protein
LIETHSFAGEAVEIRRFRPGVAVRSEVVGPDGVDRDEKKAVLRASARVLAVGASGGEKSEREQRQSGCASSRNSR